LVSDAHVPPRPNVSNKNTLKVFFFNWFLFPWPGRSFTQTFGRLKGSTLPNVTMKFFCPFSSGVRLFFTFFLTSNHLSSVRKRQVFCFFQPTILPLSSLLMDQKRNNDPLHQSLSLLEGVLPPPLMRTLCIVFFGTLPLQGRMEICFSLPKFSPSMFCNCF